MIIDENKLSPAHNIWVLLNSKSNRTKTTPTVKDENGYCGKLNPISSLDIIDLSFDLFRNYIIDKNMAVRCKTHKLHLGLNKNSKNILKIIKWKIKLLNSDK